MGKLKKIGIGIGIGVFVAVILVDYSTNTYALSNWQFGERSVNDVDYLGAELKIEVCNPTSFPLTFDKYQMIDLYQGMRFATTDIMGDRIESNQTVILNGRIMVEQGIVADVILDGLTSAIYDEATPAFDQHSITAQKTIHAKILGIIPYTITESYTFEDLREIAAKERSHSCA